jgi:surface protein
VLINSFLYERLTDENFKQAIRLWFGNPSDWNTSRVTNIAAVFKNRMGFNEDISSWNVGSVTNAPQAVPSDGAL